jgi:amidohydrolase
MNEFNIRPEVAELFEEQVRLRREIHKFPELGYELPKTTLLVSNYLKELGMTVIENFGISGIVGIIQGEGPCILLRADMDALPLLERNDVEYKSQHEGKMHACGHDAHVAMLLIAAKVLWNKRDQLKGSVKFMFQPAEEGGFGALKMIEDLNYPILEAAPRVDEVYGIHVISDQMIGDYLMADDFMSCFCDFFEILVVGTGGHMAAKTKNPVNLASEIILAIQNIVSRNIDNYERAVVSVTSFTAGEVVNAVPETALLKGTFRSFEKNVRDTIISRLSDLCKGLGQSYDCEVTLKLIPTYPPIRNSLSCVSKAEKILQKISPSGIHDKKTLMIGEDFSYLTDRRPGAFICLGTGTPGAENHPIHSTSFNINEKAMQLGSTFFVNLVLDELS